MNTYRAELNKTLRALMSENEKIVLIGQSIRDPYGGVCKVTRGLTKLFDDRIFDAPISEAAMIGWGTGLAMRGYIPIVEIMFLDFMTLCLDQIHNVAMKVAKHTPIKLIIRTMYNPDKMYGPTHSQGMTWLVDNIPGVECVDCFLCGSPMYDAYKAVIAKKSPVTIIVERKDMYGKEIVDYRCR